MRIRRLLGVSVDDKSLGILVKAIDDTVSSRFFKESTWGFVELSWVVEFRVWFLQFWSHHTLRFSWLMRCSLRMKCLEQWFLYVWSSTALLAGVGLLFNWLSLGSWGWSNQWKKLHPLYWQTWNLLFSCSGTSIVIGCAPHLQDDSWPRSHWRWGPTLFSHLKSPHPNRLGQTWYFLPWYGSKEAPLNVCLSEISTSFTQFPGLQKQMERFGRATAG